MNNLATRLEREEDNRWLARTVNVPFIYAFEKDTRAVLLFGKAFESALGAFFQRQDSSEVWFREWSRCRDAALHYSKGDSWDHMLQQGIQLLDRFCQDERMRVRQPQRNLQIKLVRSLSPQNEFVAYVDAIGYLDGTRCVLEWKTTSSRYPEEPEGLLALDPQLVCYSWMTLVLYRTRTLGRMRGNECLPRAFDKAIRTKPLAFAADAGLWGLNVGGRGTRLR
jgi:hypothetical protein